jgi:16S rRNA G966 N2-methylase RsmD
MRSGKWPSQFWGDQIQMRISEQMPLIKHWTITNKSYKDLENIEATWFIDPPYQNMGKHYKFNDIDYNDLSEWCLSRKGQVIVCEQEGADWLPFETFRNLKSLKSKSSKEVAYVQLSKLT